MSAVYDAGFAVCTTGNTLHMLGKPISWGAGRAVPGDIPHPRSLKLGRVLSVSASIPSNKHQYQHITNFGYPQNPFCYPRGTFRSIISAFSPKLKSQSHGLAHRYSCIHDLDHTSTSEEPVPDDPLGLLLYKVITCNFILRNITKSVSSRTLGHVR